MTITENGRRVTPEEFLRLPDTVGFELVDGQLVGRHVSRESSRVASRIVYLFQAAAERSGSRVEVYGSDLTYKCYRDHPDQQRRADASVIRADRLANVPADAGVMPIPADLVVEVVSPNDLAYEVSEKVAEYLENGFRVVWVADPHVRTVGVYTPDSPGRVLREEDEIDAGDLLPGFRCRVGELFAGPAPAAPAQP